MAEAGSVWVSVIPSMKGFSQKVKAEVGDLTVDVGLNVNTKDARARIDAATQDTTVNADVDVNDKAARAEIGIFRAFAQGLLDGLHADVDVDTKAADAKVAETKSRFDGLGGSILGLGGKVALFSSAGVVGLGLVGAGAAAAAGAIGLIAAPIAAAKLGSDGLKASFGQLTPQVDALKGSVSAAFQQGMHSLYLCRSRLSMDASIQQSKAL